MTRGIPPGPPWLSKVLHGYGYRYTFPREAVLQALSDTREHLSAEDVYLIVHGRYPQIGLTTVYRALDLLVKIGVVVKFDFGDGRGRFELAFHPSAKGHHHHLVCTCCGRVVDYTDWLEKEKEFLQTTEKGLKQKYDFEITDHLIQFCGKCAECRNMTNKVKGGE
ncbi:MAG: transcriptional repressor [Candidatus Omnitrophica bacterium]|nr:transcriptional repressor [Candidatus Omnitrophota bacterium]